MKSIFIHHCTAVHQSNQMFFNSSFIENQMFGPCLRITATVVGSFLIAASFTVGVVGLYQLCPDPCTSLGCPKPCNVGEINLKVIIPYVFSLGLTVFGIVMSCCGFMMMNDIDSRKSTGCCGDNNCSVTDKDCLCGWGWTNVIGAGILIAIDLLVVIGFYASDSIWNYSALCWIMFSTHASAYASLLGYWLPFKHCCQPPYEPLPEKTNELESKV